MRGVNKVILVGTLGRDPESKSFPNGGSITSFSIATTDSWIDKNSGQRQEATEWHRIATNNRLAEIAQQYLKKGSKVYIEGSLRTRKWTDKDGVERYTTEVRAESMQMLDGAPKQGNGDYQNQTSGQRTTQNTNSDVPQVAVGGYAGYGSGSESDLNDLPF